MSGWDSWVDSLKGNGTAADGSCNVSSCGIFSNEGALCASTPGFKVDPAQVKQALARTLNPMDGSVGTLSINGLNFKIVRATEDGLFLKLKGNGGGYIEKSATLVVFGIYNEGLSAGSLNAAVGKVCGHLRDAGL